MTSKNHASKDVSTSLPGGVLSPYLPSHLVLAAKRGQLPPPGDCTQATVTLLMADLSGFTLLTEQLQERGRAGAEEITEIVNTALRPMVIGIEALGGSILQFGGDAVYASFAEAGHPARAVQAASELMRLLGELGPIPSSLGPIQLTMKVMVATGKVTEFHVRAFDQTVFLVTGEACVRLEALSRGIRRGEVLVDPALLALLGPPLLPDPRGVRLEGAFQTLPPPASPAPTLSATELEGCELSGYLPSALRFLLARGPVEGEFRTVAILFLKFSVPGLEEGSEEALEILNPFLDHLTRALHELEGVLFKAGMTPLSDSLLITCGLPDAHEDDGLRAALCAVTIRERVQEELPEVRLKLAVHVGVVVAANVGGTTRRSFDIMGDAVNLTARVLERVPDNEIYLTGAVARSADTVLRLEPLGMTPLRGREGGVELYRVAGRLHSFEPRMPKRLPEFVGREPELKAIRGAVTQLKAGTGSTLGICSESGLGKSRMWFEVRKILAQESLTFSFGICPSFGYAQGYAVFADWLRRMLSLEPLAPPELIQQKVAGLAGGKLDALTQAHLAGLLGCRDGLRGARGAELKALNFQAVRKLLQSLAASGPLVLALEDLHWADPSSLELITLLARDAESIPVLLILLYRPTPLAEQLAGRRFQELRLKPLTPDAGLRLLSSLLENLPCPEAVAKRLVEQSGGVPYFLEELVRSVVEQGWLIRDADRWSLAAGARVERMPLPESIDAVLSARLHRLPLEIKRVAQRAAVIGRSFSYELLTRICDHPIEEALSTLKERELIFEIPNRGETQAERGLIFKHALVREVAYMSLLERNREALHRRIAQAMLGEKSAVDPATSEAVGWHLLLSSTPEEAVPHLLSAARQALGQGRFVDARRQAEQALDVLKRSPNAPPSPHHFPLLLVLGDVLAFQGEHARVLELYREALTLAPDAASKADLLGREAFVHLTLGTLEHAGHCATEAIRLAEECGAKSALARGLREAARVSRELGGLQQAVSWDELALRWSQHLNERIPQTLALRGMVLSLIEGADVHQATTHLKMLRAAGAGLNDRRGELEEIILQGRIDALSGRFAEAEARFQQAQSDAQTLGDPLLAAQALLRRVELAILQTDFEGALTLSDELAARCRERTTPVLDAYRIMFHYRALLLANMRSVGSLRPRYDYNLKLIRYDQEPFTPEEWDLPHLLHIPGGHFDIMRVLGALVDLRRIDVTLEKYHRNNVEYRKARRLKIPFEGERLKIDSIMKGWLTRARPYKQMVVDRVSEGLARVNLPQALFPFYALWKIMAAEMGTPGEVPLTAESLLAHLEVNGTPGYLPVIRYVLDCYQNPKHVI